MTPDSTVLLEAMRLGGVVQANDLGSERLRPVDGAPNPCGKWKQSQMAACLDELFALRHIAPDYTDDWLEAARRGNMVEMRRAVVWRAKE